MFHPFLDAKNFTDDELQDKITKANGYLNMQKKLGHAEAIQSIEAVLDALEEEKRTRFYNATKKEFDKQNPNASAPLNIGVTEPKKEYKDEQ